ncbi:MAG: hypothetical protein KC657_00275 [Myxococcales bacterium]|nr:hypothetical protein [Myxococcales bacterium]
MSWQLRGFAPWLVALTVALGLVALTSLAHAQQGRRAGRISLRTASGSRGPLVLRPGADGLAGELFIDNLADEPLVVSRVAPRTDASDPRLPPTVAIKVAEGALPLTIPPHTSKGVTVSWVPDPNNRQTQLLGHVIVTSSDDLTGEVAMGIRARVPSRLRLLDDSALSLLVAAPFGGALFVWGLRARRRDGGASVWRASVVTCAVTALLALYVYARFSPQVTSADGGDGLQLVRHASWVSGLGAEIFFAVDGVSVFQALVVVMLAFIGLLTERRPPEGAAGYYATYLLLLGATLGFLVSFDLALLVVFGSTAVAAAGLLVGAWGHEGRAESGAGLLTVGAFALVALFVAVALLVRNGEPSFLVDGARARWTFSQPELARVTFAAQPVTVLSAPLWKVAYVLIFLSAIALLGAFPFHGWFLRAVSTARTSTSILVGAALPALGLVILLRLGCAILPEGMRWGSGVTVAVGAVTVAYAGLLAIGEDDIARFAGASAAAQTGFVLLGAGSLTPQGIGGAIVHASARALALGLFLLVVWAIQERTAERSLSKLGGVAGAMPRCGFALGVASIANAGVLGSAAGWGVMLALFGALPNFSAFAIVAAVGLVIVTAAQLRVTVRLMLAPLAPSWAESPALAPWDGKLPDLTPREQSSVVPLAVVALLLGFWPGPVLATVVGTTRDLADAVNPPGPGHVSARDVPRLPTRLAAVFVDRRRAR